MTEDEEPGTGEDGADTEPDEAETSEEPDEAETSEEPDEPGTPDEADRPGTPDGPGDPGTREESPGTREASPGTRGDGAPASDGLDSVMEGSESFPDTDRGTTPDDGDEGGSLFDDDAFSAESLGTAEPDPEPSSPFDELASDVGASDADDVDFEELFEEMFTEAEAGEIDEEWVWDELEGTSVGDGETGGEEHVVPTRAFCAQCEHVAEPPEVACTYEGSEIVEFVDKDNVRVRNCPIVARRQEVSEME